jgi:hypothetical protein
MRCSRSVVLRYSLFAFGLTAIFPLFSLLEYVVCVFLYSFTVSQVLRRLWDSSVLVWLAVDFFSWCIPHKLRIFLWFFPAQAINKLGDECECLICFCLKIHVSETTHPSTCAIRLVRTEIEATTALESNKQFLEDIPYRKEKDRNFIIIQCLIPR